MLRIEKSVAGEVVDVIEKDNYTIKTYTKPTQSVVDMILNMVTNDGQTIPIGGRYPERRLKEVADLSVPQIAKSLNGGSMLLINSKNDQLQGVIPPCGVNTSIQGVVGYVETDWASYSGTSTTRGTMNLSESNRPKNRLGRYDHHIVVDFPTHACNGEIDKIVLLDHGVSTTSNQLYSGYCKSTRYFPRIVDLVACHVTGITTSTTNIYFGLTKDGVKISRCIMSSSAVTITLSKGNILSNINLSNYFSSEGLTGDKFTIVMINDEPYLNYRNHTSSANTSAGYLNNQWIAKMNIIVDEVNENITFEIGERQKLNVIFKDFGWTTSQAPYVRTVCLDNGINIVSCLNLKKSVIYDSQWNIIKTLPYEVTNSQVFKNDANIFYVISGNVLDYQFNEIGTLSMAYSNYSTNFLYTGGKNMMVSSSYHKLLDFDSTTNGSDGFEVYEVAQTYQPSVVIELVEPLNKTNVETLKLIFDFNITIQ